MRIWQKKFAWALLGIFAAISCFLFFAPDAAPYDSSKTKIVAVEEGHCVQGDILRSATEIQKEDAREDHVPAVSHLREHHSVVVNARAHQSQLMVFAAPHQPLFISYSRLLI
jgi:hypothetical protein